MSDDDDSTPDQGDAVPAPSGLVSRGWRGKGVPLAEAGGNVGARALNEEVYAYGFDVEKAETVWVHPDAWHFVGRIGQRDVQLAQRLYLRVHVVEAADWRAAAPRTAPAEPPTPTPTAQPPVAPPSAAALPPASAAVAPPSSATVSAEQFDAFTAAHPDWGQRKLWGKWNTPGGGRPHLSIDAFPKKKRGRPPRNSKP